MAAARRKHRVAVLLLPPVVGFDAVIPSQLLGAARDAEGRSFYDVSLISLDGGPVPTEAGYQLLPTGDVTALRRANTVIVPGTRIFGPRRTGELPAEVAAALDRIRAGTRIVSICTGAFVLAAAGLLDGRPVTTHWAYAEDFRRLYPAVKLDESQLFIDDGQVLSSAGVAAGIDLCLHLIRRDHGAAVANSAARVCVVPPWREGGQAQYIEHPVPVAGADSTAATREWALRRLGQPLEVAALANHARQSVRTFNRRFKAETGSAPGAWLLEQRLNRARQLLETTDLPIDEVAERSGLGSAATLRQHLRVAVGVSPSDYRRTFRG